MTSKYETQVHLNARNSSPTLITELVGTNKRVLDVGCATGYLAAALAPRGCETVGIEIDAESARRAEEHCERVIVGDVESMDLDKQLEGQTFDAIIFGDVLEHLKDPLRALERLVPFLQDGGYVVASIPNVAHGSVRLALMRGRFQYNRLGLLDNTHLRFFTRQSVERLFGDAGLLITDLRRTIRSVFDTEVEVEREEIPDEVLEVVQRDPEALTYQFVVAAHRSGKEAMLAKRAQLLSEQLAARDRKIYELNRRVRNFDELQRMLESRTKQLTEKEHEVTALAREVADRNDRLARLVQFGREQT